jgi:hypothetical protein
VSSALTTVERDYQKVLARTKAERKTALAARCKAVANAHDAEGMTYEAIGEAIGIHNSLAVRLAAQYRRSLCGGKDSE